MSKRIVNPDFYTKLSDADVRAINRQAVAKVIKHRMITTVAIYTVALGATLLLSRKAA